MSNTSLFITGQKPFLRSSIPISSHYDANDDLVKFAKTVRVASIALYMEMHPVSIDRMLEYRNHKVALLNSMQDPQSREDIQEQLEAEQQVDAFDTAFAIKVRWDILRLQESQNRKYQILNAFYSLSAPR